MEKYERPNTIITVCFEMGQKKRAIGRRYEYESGHGTKIGTHTKIN